MYLVGAIQALKLSPVDVVNIIWNLTIKCFICPAVVSSKNNAGVMCSCQNETKLCN